MYKWSINKKNVKNKIFVFVTLCAYVYFDFVNFYYLDSEINI